MALSLSFFHAKLTCFSRIGQATSHFQDHSTDDQSSERYRINLLQQQTPADCWCYKWSYGPHKRNNSPRQVDLILIKLHCLGMWHCRTGRMNRGILWQLPDMYRQIVVQSLKLTRCIQHEMTRKISGAEVQLLGRSL
jgi:hypothetical protein